MSDHLSVHATEDPDGRREVTVVYTPAVVVEVVEDERPY